MSTTAKFFYYVIVAIVVYGIIVLIIRANTKPIQQNIANPNYNPNPVIIHQVTPVAPISPISQPRPNNNNVICVPRGPVGCQKQYRDPINGTVYALDHSESRGGITYCCYKK